VALTIGWLVARPRVLANTGGRLGARWHLTDPRDARSGQH
jgi:hypothetical protein